MQPPDELIANEEISAVRAALDKLDPAEQAILAAIFADGVTEVEACGLPATEWQRANKIVNRAMRAFARAFSQADGTALAAEELERIDDDTSLHKFGVPLEVVKNLDDRTRAAAVLHYLSGATVNQIAFRLGIDSHVAWQSLQRANAAIQQHHDAREKFGDALERIKHLDGQVYLVAKLHLIGGTMLRDIAKELGISKSTASNWLKKAKAAMQSV